MAPRYVARLRLGSGGLKTRREEWENRFRSRGRETARLAANGAMLWGGLASGAHRGTSRRAAGAGSLFTEG